MPEKDNTPYCRGTRSVPFCSKSKSLAILGGTFDPIHNAHLNLAHVLLELKFHKVLFIPCKQNPLKANVKATTQQRVTMIQLALASFKEVYHCDLREIERDKPSLTIDTLKSLREDYPDDALTFTMGIDSFNDLEQWDNFEEFLNYSHLLVFPRPKYLLKPKPSVRVLIDKAKTSNINDLHEKKHGCIYFSENPKNAISSTEIRTLLKNTLHSTPCHTAETYLPNAVFNYIQKNKLYF